MYDFGSVLFWYKLLFVAELTVAAAIFTVNLRRRERFALRAVLSIAGQFVLAFAIPVAFYNAAWTCFMFFVMFIGLIVGMKICFAESFQNILFCALAAYTIQHIAFVVFDSFGDLAETALGITIDSNVYLSDASISEGAPMAVEIIVYLAAYISVYMTARYAYTDKIKPDDASKLGRVRFIVLAAIIIITDNIFNAVTMYNVKIDTTSLWIERGYNVFTCLLSMQLQFSQLTERNIQTKYDAVQHILQEEQKQYKLVKQNLDTVNIKCHDMKHQLRRLNAGGLSLGKDEIQEIEKVMSIYDSVVKTGNETLDLILAEKNLLHSSDGVVITCIADGKLLNFMSPTEMYSLFGNALDNAIEAVEPLEKSKRNISLMIKNVGDMVSVHVENYYNGDAIVYSGGLPKSTKGDDTYHGFGMISMKTIVERYGGTLAYEAADSIFSLNMLFPLPASVQKSDEPPNA